MTRFGKVLRFAASLALLTGAFAGSPSLQEDQEDSFKKWLSEDVVYIISAQERDVFLELSTEDEQLAFIEQFWSTRDPNPQTAENEFKDEYYRRIAYANDYFHEGKAGWRTDRGMLYIKFGPPDRRQTNPTGGRVFRTPREVQASDSMSTEMAMTALPFEVWEYRFIPGLGLEVAFELVAKGGGSSYKLVMNPDEKDALFFETGAHLMRRTGRNEGMRIFGGSALDRLDKFVDAYRPLRLSETPATSVSADVQYSEVPFEVEHRLGFENGESVCDVYVKVPHSSLSFNKQIDRYTARLDVSVYVTDVRKVLVGHREDQLAAQLGAENVDVAGSGVGLAVGIAVLR